MIKQNQIYNKYFSLFIIIIFSNSIVKIHFYLNKNFKNIKIIFIFNNMQINDR